MICQDMHRRELRIDNTDSEATNFRLLKQQGKSTVKTDTLLKAITEKLQDQIRPRKVKLNSIMLKDARTKSNAMFKKDEAKIYQQAKGKTSHTGEISNMDKSFKFWDRIWQEGKRTNETDK